MCVFTFGPVRKFSSVVVAAARRSAALRMVASRTVGHAPPVETAPAARLLPPRPRSRRRLPLPPPSLPPTAVGHPVSRAVAPCRPEPHQRRGQSRRLRRRCTFPPLPPRPAAAAGGGSAAHPVGHAALYVDGAASSRAAAAAANEGHGRGDGHHGRCRRRRSACFCASQRLHVEREAEGGSRSEAAHAP